jgi:betaine-aldehyde dehydrogenase
VQSNNATDWDVVVDWVMCGIFICSGQVCSASSRLLVERPLMQGLLDRLIAKSKSIRVGNPLLEPSTQMGPLVSELQAQRVHAAVEKAVAEGCTVLLGGKPLLDKGLCYYPPTILLVPETQGKQVSAWTEEIFGPVLCVRAFDTEPEAVAIANGTTYGLADAVFTRDDQRWERVRAALNTGLVWRNANQALLPCTPFGGKQGTGSGFGHEGGEHGLLEYVSTKSSVVARRDQFSWKWFD